MWMLVAFCCIISVSTTNTTSSTSSFECRCGTVTMHVDSNFSIVDASSDGCIINRGTPRLVDFHARSHEGRCFTHIKFEECEENCLPDIAYTVTMLMNYRSENPPLPYNKSVNILKWNSEVDFELLHACCTANCVPDLEEVVDESDIIGEWDSFANASAKITHLIGKLFEYDLRSKLVTIAIDRENVMTMGAFTTTTITATTTEMPMTWRTGSIFLSLVFLVILIVISIYAVRYFINKRKHKKKMRDIKNTTVEPDIESPPSAQPEDEVFRRVYTQPDVGSARVPVANSGGSVEAPNEPQNGTAKKGNGE